MVIDSSHNFRNIKIYFVLYSPKCYKLTNSRGQWCQRLQVRHLMLGNCILLSKMKLIDKQIDYDYIHRFGTFKTIPMSKIKWSLIGTDTWWNLFFVCRNTKNSCNLKQKKKCATFLISQERESKNISCNMGW